MIDTRANLIHSVHSSVNIDGVRMHVVESGDGPPVILLHGFPDFWYSWRHQMPALARHGFRAIAPDLRGYNESDRPTDVSSYRAAAVVRDIAGLIDEVGGSAFVVGHDWGGLIAWRLAALHPDLVRKLVILNAPHPAAFRKELMLNPLQWLRSTYALYFQLSWLPERTLGAQDFGVLEHAWRRQSVHMRAFSDFDIAQYKRAMADGGLTGPLNYYRAALRYPSDLFGPPQTVDVPTLLIWGERDTYLCPSLVDRMRPWVPNLEVHRVPYVGHWVHNDVPQRVNRLLIEFFESDEFSPNNGAVLSEAAASC